MITGATPTLEEAADLLACCRLASVFFERLDTGDLEAAFQGHLDDVRFFGPDGSGPLDRAAAVADATRVRFAYPGRETLHVLSQFVGDVEEDGVVRARYLMTVYELTERLGDRTVPRPVPVVFVLAREEAVFRRTEAGWRYAEQRLVPIAPRRTP